LRGPALWVGPCFFEGVWVSEASWFDLVLDVRMREDRQGLPGHPKATGEKTSKGCRAAQTREKGGRSA